MIENSAESPPIFANQQPGFFKKSADKKTFSAKKDSFSSNFNFKLRLSGRIMRIAG